MTALVHPNTLHTTPVVQVVENVQPLVLPFSNPPLVTTLPEQVGAQTRGVGVPVTLGVGVMLGVGEIVRVRLIVHVRVIVLVLQGVHETVRVAGHVIEGVGESGTAQQMDTST